jgi:hypothetical protein
MAPQRRKDFESSWEWVHVLDAEADVLPGYERKRGPSANMRAAEERLDKRLDEFEQKLGDLRGLSDRVSDLVFFRTPQAR